MLPIRYAPVRNIDDRDDRDREHDHHRDEREDKRRERTVRGQLWWYERDRDFFEFPDAPEPGDVVVNRGIGYTWDGQKWVRAGSRRHAATNVALSHRPPAHPMLGQLWMEPREKRLAVWLGKHWEPVGGTGEFLSTKGGTIHGDLRVSGTTTVNVLDVRPGWWEQEHPDHDHHDREHNERR